MKEILKFQGEEWEEISYGEFNKLPDKETSFFTIDSKRKHYYFKKVQKFPRVFENEDRKIEVDKDGNIVIMNKINRDFIRFYGSQFLLEEALEFSKQVRKEIKK